MLDALRRIVQEVSAAESLQAALDIIVSRVQEAMQVEVCTVYLHDMQSDRYIFSANRGLNPDFVGKMSLAANEGLVGLVATREEPINLDDAESHPNFLFLPGIGEERYHSFLGVPIIHQREMLGVIVVQQQDRRKFDEDEEALLITLSAQLAGVIAHSQATGTLPAIAGQQSSGGKTRFAGVAGSPGIAIGHGVVVTPGSDLYAVPDRPCQNVEAELKFFHDCLAAVRRDIKELGQKLSSRLAAEEQALFDVYLHMLDDHAMAAEVDQHIRDGQWAQGAWSRVIISHVRTFDLMDDDYFRERATDVKDLGRRVLGYLQSADTDPIEYPEDTILVGEELTASMLGEVPPEKLKGLVSVRGSSNSHVAILARAMGIPTVVGAMVS